jgi:hypothetical protein
VVSTPGGVVVTSFEQLAAQRPQNIDQALPCMRRMLQHFHEHNDYRAVFLRAYYIITLNVHAAVHQRGDYQRPIFFDSAWINSLGGKFASLYFQSLGTLERDPGAERAWKLAHQMAQDKASTVIQDLMLGLNAHINYDLAYGIQLNLREHGDGQDHLLLPRRKFDHDQVNNILVRSTPQIAATLTRDYGGAIAFLDTVMHRLDDHLSEAGLKYYRERVWWNAISFLTTQDDEEVELVRAKLDWESGRLAELLADKSSLSLPLRLIGRAIRKEHFEAAPLEPLPAKTPTRTARRAMSPF